VENGGADKGVSGWCLWFEELENRTRDRRSILKMYLWTY
jgi:hypothetical protein